MRPQIDKDLVALIAKHDLILVRDMINRAHYSHALVALQIRKARDFGHDRLRKAKRDEAPKNQSAEHISSAQQATGSPQQAQRQP